MSDRKHEDFNAYVVVNRLEDSGAFVADIRVKCAQCELPFEFPGLPVGLSCANVTVSWDGQELRVPLKPSDSKFFPAFAGYGVKQA